MKIKNGRQIGYGIAGLLMGIIAYTILGADIPTDTYIETEEISYEEYSHDLESSPELSEEKDLNKETTSWFKFGTYHLTQADFDKHEDDGVVTYGKENPTSYQSIKEKVKDIVESTIDNNPSNQQQENWTQLEQAFGTHPDTVNYKLIEVDGGDTSGHRQANVVVDIGYGDREYWAYTNQYGQLVKVVAKEIILQDDTKENVTSDGRYYSKIADVPGVGADLGYDRGHVIADSLGGVANAYNITPQEATLNRHGDQAYMERNIREAGGATDFEAIITYPNTETQTPSHYQYTYTIKGTTVTDSFENKNPDKVNQDLGITNPASKPSAPSKSESTSDSPTSSEVSDLNKANPGNVAVGNVSAVDTNGNGTVTIQEAKDAGFNMPVYQGHWLYEYMRDNNKNGMVGE